MLRRMTKIEMPPLVDETLLARVWSAPDDGRVDAITLFVAIRKVAIADIFLAISALGDRLVVGEAELRSLLDDGPSGRRLHQAQHPFGIPFDEDPMTVAFSR